MINSEVLKPTLINKAGFYWSALTHFNGEARELGHESNPNPLPVMILMLRECGCTRGAGRQLRGDVAGHGSGREGQVSPEKRSSGTMHHLG